ncbi:uncharacterized protein [Gossypium hirsutum]|uniref:Uncharacterized protein n=1 Tax=Gossypium hirsutum TaxID=3635 RepID=A0ABM3B783_GOSHI|nr:uncharacterized protein LOC121224186 [Gossypium hirsutum]
MRKLPLKAQHADPPPPGRVTARVMPLYGAILRPLYQALNDAVLQSLQNQNFLKKNHFLSSFNTKQQRNPLLGLHLLCRRQSRPTHGLRRCPNFRWRWKREHRNKTGCREEKTWRSLPRDVRQLEACWRRWADMRLILRFLWARLTWVLGY